MHGIQFVDSLKFIQVKRMKWNEPNRKDEKKTSNTNHDDKRRKETQNKNAKSSINIKFHNSFGHINQKVKPKFQIITVELDRLLRLIQVH